MEERELEWLLKETQSEVHNSIKEGLEECLARLCEKHGEYKLVVSSNKSEVLKGIVTRSGPALVNVDVSVKMPHLNKNHTLPIKLANGKKYALEQLVDASNHLLHSSRIASGPFKISNGYRVKFDINEMLTGVRSAMKALKEPLKTRQFPNHAIDLGLFEGLKESAENIAINFYIAESSIITDIRSFEYADHQPFWSLGKRKHPEVDFNGRQAIELERVIVESQDPNLITVSAKLGALESHLEVLRKKLDIVLEMIESQPHLSQL
ncbi:hypothetical protein TRVA0_001S05710 [Trichomonascus vanleenenianus]|uniref:Rav2p n=1 Tax=Trichomonascus vanleenenianus TaxID=2268995 RepID=UPI003ECAFA31